MLLYLHLIKTLFKEGISSFVGITIIVIGVFLSTDDVLCSVLRFLNALFHFLSQLLRCIDGYTHPTSADEEFEVLKPSVTRTK